MKRILSILLAFIILFTFSACNESENKDEIEVKEEKTQTEEPNEEIVNYQDELIKIKVEGGDLAGILTTPIKTTSKSLPIVLFVPSAGEVPKNGVANEFEMLSIELANRGIASLRYDKRGSFDSNGIQIKEEKIKVADYVADISAILDRIKNDKKFTDVFVLGHYQGALYGALAIQKNKVDGFISVGGAGRTIDVLLKEQIKENELNPQVVIDEANFVISELKKGNKVEVSELVERMFRPSIQNYLIDWISYDPVEVYKKIENTPILIIQGKNDIQVKEKDAKLLAEALEGNEPILIDKMSHVLKDAATKEDREEHMKIYNNVNAPLNEKFITAVITFINENKKEIKE